MSPWWGEKLQYCIEKGEITAVQKLGQIVFYTLVKFLGLVRAPLAPTPISHLLEHAFLSNPANCAIVKVIGSHNTNPNCKGKTPRQLLEASLLF